MPNNTISLYVGAIPIDSEAIIKARLRRIAPPRSAAGSMLIPLIVDVKPEVWALLLEDAYPDEEDLAVFLVRLVSCSPGIIQALRSALTMVEEHREGEALSRREAIIEAASALEELTPNQSTITEENLDSPGFSKGSIEARLRSKLGT